MKIFNSNIGITCIVVSLLLLSGCLRQMGAKVKGNPLRPTFVFEKKIILGEFTIDVYDVNEKSKVKDVWGISGDPNAQYYYTQELEFGVVPPGLTEYIPLRNKELMPNRLYSFGFHNGNIRGSGAFAIVEKNGELKIVQFDKKKTFEEILDEFQELMK